jgi:hypothetical protein
MCDDPNLMTLLVMIYLVSTWHCFSKCFHYISILGIKMVTCFVSEATSENGYLVTKRSSNLIYNTGIYFKNR